MAPRRWHRGNPVQDRPYPLHKSPLRPRSSGLQPRARPSRAPRGIGELSASRFNGQRQRVAGTPYVRPSETIGIAGDRICIGIALALAIASATNRGRAPRSSRRLWPSHSSATPLTARPSSGDQERSSPIAWSTRGRRMDRPCGLVSDRARLRDRSRGAERALAVGRIRSRIERRGDDEDRFDRFLHSGTVKIAFPTTVARGVAVAVLEVTGSSPRRRIDRRQRTAPDAPGAAAVSLPDRRRRGRETVVAAFGRSDAGSLGGSLRVLPGSVEPVDRGSSASG